MKFKVGDKAPEFTLENSDGEKISLRNFKGKNVVLYFYPKDFTLGCTKEACSFRDDYSGIKKYAEIIGISNDTVDSHKKFAEKHGLPFILLSDTKRKAIKLYGAQRKFFGHPVTRRVTFIIDKKGKIARIFSKVNPVNHSREVLEVVRNLHA